MKKHTINVPTDIFSDFLYLDHSDQIQSIDKIGDELRQTTNVKATMTSYTSHVDHYDQFQLLYRRLDHHIFCNMWSDHLERNTHSVAEPLNVNWPDKTNQARTTFIINLWGMKYTYSQEAIPHNHYPSAWSFIYYLKVENPGELVFFDNTEFNTPTVKITPKNNMIILFPGYMMHAVAKQPPGVRYCVAGNISRLEETNYGNILAYKHLCEKYPDVVKKTFPN